MKIHFNHQVLTTPAGTTLAEFLAAQKFGGENLLIEYNTEIVNPEAAADFQLKDGDKLNVYKIVAGG